MTQDSNTDLGCTWLMRATRPDENRCNRNEKSWDGPEPPYGVVLFQISSMECLWLRGGLPTCRWSIAKGWKVVAEVTKHILWEGPLLGPPRRQCLERKQYGRWSTIIGQLRRKS